MSTPGALYKVHEDRVQIPVGRREVSRVAVSPSHVTLELTSLKDPLTSTVDLFAIESIDLRASALTRHPALGADAKALVGILGRRVTSCVGTPDGSLELRLTGSASVRSRSWAVGLGDGRHWAPHVDGRVAEWRPGKWRPDSVRRRRRPRWQEQRLDATTPLPLVGQQLQDISFSEVGLGLLFSVDVEGQPHRAIERLPDVEVELKGDLVLGPDGDVINGDTPRSVAPLLALVGIATTGATATPEGELEIRFANSAVLTAGPGDGHQWAMTIADLGGWYLAKDGSARSSKPEDTRPLTDTQRDLLVRAYLEYSATDRADLFWATDRLRDLIEHAPDDAYEVIRELVRLAPSPYVLSIVAAGPLEDLLSDWGERLIDRLETDARDDPKLMAACAGVWKLYMSDDVWGRLGALVGRDGARLA
jgi:hypothetical protein